MTFEEYICNGWHVETLAEWFENGPIAFYDENGPYESLEFYDGIYGSIDFYMNYMDYLGEENGLPGTVYDDYRAWCLNYMDSFYDGFHRYGGYENSRPPIYAWVIYVNNCSDEAIGEVLNYSDAYCGELFDIYVQQNHVVLETQSPAVTPSPAPIETLSPSEIVVTETSVEAVSPGSAAVESYRNVDIMILAVLGLIFGALLVSELLRGWFR